jgi:hypothetical protein
MPQVPVLAYILTAVVSFGAGWLAYRARVARLHAQARDIREHLLAEARKDAEELRKGAKLEAREEVLQARQRFESETEKSRREHTRRQEALDQRETALAQKAGFLDKSPTWRDRGGSQARAERRRSSLERSGGLARRTSAKAREHCDERDAAREMLIAQTSTPRATPPRNRFSARISSAPPSARRRSHQPGGATLLATSPGGLLVDLPNEEIRAIIGGAATSGVRRATGVMSSLTTRRKRSSSRPLIPSVARSPSSLSGG